MPPTAEGASAIMSEAQERLHASIDEYITFAHDTIPARELFQLGLTLEILEEGAH